MLERVDFFIREIGAIPVADTARIWSRCLNEINGSGAKLRFVSQDQS
jgi:hypothetical protein